MASYRDRNPARFWPELRRSGRRFAAAAVIPVHDEEDFLGETLHSLAAALRRTERPVAVFVVVNHPPGASRRAVEADLRVLAALRKSAPELCGGLVCGETLFPIALMENSGGVGSARKAGMDSALAVLDENAPGGGLIASLDADAPVSPDYWEKLFLWSDRHPDYAGAVCHFEHRFAGEAALRRAGALYELYLRDYARQCRECGSHYGFWTLGSAFAAHGRDYERAGGMRRRTGGEDFYFLQALRKVGRVGLVPDATVYPSGRPSERVPFGTGPAVRRLAGGDTERFGFQNPACFAELRGFYRGTEQADYETLAGGTGWNGGAWAARYLAEQCDFAAVWPKVVRNTPRRKEALLEALHRFADGLFILQFCHFLETAAPERFGRYFPAGDIAGELAGARAADRELTGFA